MGRSLDWRRANPDRRPRRARERARIAHGRAQRAARLRRSREPHDRRAKRPPPGAATRSATSATRLRWRPSRAHVRSTSRWSAPTSRWPRAWSTRCSPRAPAPSGPTRAGAEIEWNKAFARSLLAEVAPEASPLLHVAHDRREVDEAIASFGSTPVAVKPPGLTGGKGVKVMGPHLADHDEARDYALEPARGAARPAKAVLIEEKIIGAEFTIQAISDGRTVVFPPSTYDYPYRFDGDEGPGTGGMGSLSMPSPTLPFMTAAHYERGLLDHRARDRAPGRARAPLHGVMNSGFFATADGVKVIEFNARFGDPECMNIMSLFEGSWPEVMEQIAAGEPHARRRAAARGGLARALPRLARLRPAPGPRLRVRARPRAHRSRRLPRVLLLGRRRSARTPTARSAPRARSRWRPRAPTLEQARARVVASAGTVPVLEWRRDVGDERYLDGLRGLVWPEGSVQAEPCCPTPAESFVQGWRHDRRAARPTRSSSRTPTSSPTARADLPSSSTPAARSSR